MAQALAEGQSAIAARRGSGWQRWDRADTPGRLREMLAWLIIATLAWGALATVTASQHASSAGTVVTASEPLAYDALQLWQSLSDANDEASAAGRPAAGCPGAGCQADGISRDCNF